MRNPTLAATVGDAIIVAAFAACATNQEGPVQQRAGFQRLADSLRQHGRAAVGIRVAGVILLANQQRWRLWRWRRRADGGGGGGIGNAATK